MISPMIFQSRPYFPVSLSASTLKRSCCCLCFLFLFADILSAKTFEGVQGSTFEVMDYRSASRPNQTLTAVFTADGRIFFLLRTADSVRYLQEKPDSAEPMLSGKGRPLTDVVFKSVLIKDPRKTRSGITTYATVMLFEDADMPLVFSLYQRPPATITPAVLYSYGDDQTYGIVRLHKLDGMRYEFSAEIVTGNPDQANCGPGGELLLKQGIGYVQEQQSEGADDCALLFVFGSGKLYVYMLTDGYFCACGPGATMSGVYHEGL